MLTIVLFDRAPPPTSIRHGTGPYNMGEGNRTRVRGVGMLPRLAPSRYRPENEILVDVIFSAHSDGLMAILRKA